jgi:hypothetical protein
MRHTAAAFLAASLACLVASCARSAGEGRAALVWTDVPELAIAAEIYDALPEARGSGAVELRWVASLSESLRPAGDAGLASPGAARRLPALAIGRYLGSAAARDRFVPLDGILDGADGKAFYPLLLEAGVVGGKRALIPVSFNLPLIVFARGSPAAGDGFTLSLPEMSAPSASFNAKAEGAYSRMGFSPRWYGDFLVSALEAGGARLANGRDLAWSELGLESALGEIASWCSRANGASALEDDFQFKYLYAPPYRYVAEGRALYAYMDSAAFFASPEAKRADLDFRFFAQSGRVPVLDGIVCAGLVRGAPRSKEAEAFLRWLLRPASQRAILERSRQAGTLDSCFGVAGGFSSIGSVNEEIFPAYYPALVGHAPPSQALYATAPLPEDWPALKAEVVGPWAVEASADLPARMSELPARIRELSARVADFRKRGARP